MTSKSLKGKKILITGITGFIGKHLAKKLESQDAVVYGLSHSVQKDTILKGNILSLDTINKIVNDKEIQICIHLAGESLVESGQEKPYETFMVNIQGTLNILESARINNLEKVIISSTSHVYGRNRLPYYEGYTPKPTRPYETSKACSDLLAQSYAESFNLPVLIPRFVNVYGPGDHNFNRVIPKIMKALYTDGIFSMWGGDARRDFLFIDDAVNAYIAMAKLDITAVMKNRIFNFGSGNIISVKELVEKVRTLSKEQIDIQRIQSVRPSEIRAQYVSFKKAEKLIGWKPKVSLDDGLIRTIEWYREYFNNLHKVND